MTVLRFFLVFGCLGFFSTPVLAEDIAAPSQEVRTDDLPEGYLFSISGDVLSAVFGELGLTVDISTTQATSVAFSFGWSNDGYVWLESGLRLSPFSDGVGGFFVGAVGRMELAREDAWEVVLGGAADIGYQYIWADLLIGASLGVTYQYNFEAKEAELLPRFNISIGYAWPM